MSDLWGLIFEGLVVDKVSTDPTGRYAPTVQTADLSQVQPEPEVGWTATETAGAWSFTAPPAPPAPTLAQQAAAVLAAGCQIVSTGTPALSATYPCDAQTQTGIMAETISLLQNNGTFLDGTTSVEFPDTAGAMHTFTVAQFKAWNSALGAYVGALTKAANSGTGTLPSLPITIA